MGKLFEVIRPKSLDDPIYEDFEYLIRWQGRDGAEYWYMYYDAEFVNETENTTVNREDSDMIQALINRNKRSVILQADNISLNDVDIFVQLFENKYVTRIFKDGTSERFAPDSNSFRDRLTNGRYTISFRLIRSDTANYK